MFWLKLLLVLCANCARQCSGSVVCLRVAARGPLSDAALSVNCVSSDPAEHKKVGCDCTGLQVQFDCSTIGGCSGKSAPQGTLCVLSRIARASFRPAARS